MSKTINEIALMAANWWADKVIAPKFDNGEQSGTGFMIKAMAELLVEPVTENQRELFVSYLSKEIEVKLSENKRVILSVDYHPDLLLADAATFAEISLDNFPWKSCMWISKNHISVCYGYMKAEQYIYSNKAYWQDQINSLKQSINDYKNGRMLNYIEDKNQRNTAIKNYVQEIENHIAVYEMRARNAEE